MAPPTSYTEASLAAWMKAEIRDVATLLNWTSTTPGDYAQAVNRTLRAYGVSDIASATDMEKLEALALREVWKAAVSALTAAHDYEADGGDYKLNQALQAAERMLARATREASVYDSRRFHHSASSSVVPRW